MKEEEMEKHKMTFQHPFFYGGVRVERQQKDGMDQRSAPYFFH